MAHKLSLKTRLLNYFKKNHSTWVPSGEMQRIVMKYTTYTPQNVGRRLRELTEEGSLDVKYVKGHAHYKLSGFDNRKLLEFFDNYENIKER